MLQSWTKFSSFLRVQDCSRSVVKFSVLLLALEIFSSVVICLTSCTIPRIPGARYIRCPLVHTRNHRLEETRERNLSHPVLELTWSQKYWNAHNCNAYSELAILPQPRQRPLSFWSKSQSYVFLGSTIRDQLHAHSVNAHTVPSSTSMHIELEKSPTSPESPLWARQDGHSTFLQSSMDSGQHWILTLVHIISSYWRNPYHDSESRPVWFTTIQPCIRW